MKNSNTTEHNEKGFNGKLKDGDLWEFKHNIENKEDLSRELRLQEELNETIRDTEKLRMRKNLNKAYMKTNYVSGFTTRWKLQSIAAAVIIMLLVGGGVMFNYLQSSSTSNLALYSEYFDIDSELFTVRSDKHTSNNSVAKGINAFNNEEFNKAIELFNKDNNNMASKLYAGFSYMQLSDFANAELKFSDIIKDDNNLFIDQAEFNLALCYIATDKLVNAKDVLHLIINKNTAYSIKSQELLNSMEE